MIRSLILTLLLASTTFAANELTALVPSSSSGVYAVIRNPANNGQGYDVTTDDGSTYLTYDRTDADQQIAMGSAIAVGVGDERQFATLPSGLSTSAEYVYDVYDSADELIGTFRFLPGYSAQSSPDVNVASVDADAIEAGDFATGAIDADALASDAASEVSSAILGASAAAFVTNGTLGAIINDLENGGRLDVIFDSTDSVVDSTATNVTTALGNTIAILADTEVIGPTGGGLTSLATQASVNTIDGIIDNIYTAFENDGGVYRLTTNAFDQAPNPDLSVVTDAIAALNDLDAAGVRAALGMATNDLDTQLDAIVQDTGTTLPSQISGISSAGTPSLLQSTTLSSVTDQRTVVLAAGSADDDAYNLRLAVITDQSTSTQKAVTWIRDYDGGTKTAYLGSTPGFTIAADDLISILAQEYRHTDINQENVPTARTFVLEPNDALGLQGDATRSLTVGDTRTFAVDFRKDLPAGGRVATVASAAISSGTSGGVTFGELGRDRGQAKVQMTGVTAGTYVIRVTVMYDTGVTAIGDVTLKVAD